MNTIQPTGNPRRAESAPVAAALSDPELVAQVLKGDEAAFEFIMRRHNRLLFRLARSILPTDSEAADAVQESYVRAYYRLSQFKGPAGFPSWLSRIVINESISRTRGKQLTVDGDVQTDQIPATNGPRPEDLAMNQDVRRLLETAIDSLPPDFRIVFMLRGVEELTVAETADLLGIKQATVKTRFHRARKLLRESLSNRLESAAPNSFSFAGERCDAIVHNVFLRLRPR